MNLSLRVFGVDEDILLARDVMLAQGGPASVGDVDCLMKPLKASSRHQRSMIAEPGFLAPNIWIKIHLTRP